MHPVLASKPVIFYVKLIQMLDQVENRDNKLEDHVVLAVTVLNFSN